MANSPREPPFDINALDIASPTAADEIKKYHKFATENKALIDSMADGAEKNEWSRKQKKWTSAFNVVFRARKALSGKGAHSPGKNAAETGKDTASTSTSNNSTEPRHVPQTLASSATGTVSRSSPGHPEFEGTAIGSNNDTPFPGPMITTKSPPEPVSLTAPTLHVEPDNSESTQSLSHDAPPAALNSNGDASATTPKKSIPVAQHPPTEPAHAVDPQNPTTTGPPHPTSSRVDEASRENSGMNRSLNCQSVQVQTPPECLRTPQTEADGQQFIDFMVEGLKRELRQLLHQLDENISSASLAVQSALPEYRAIGAQVASIEQQADNLSLIQAGIATSCSSFQELKNSLDNATQAFKSIESLTSVLGEIASTPKTVAELKQQFEEYWHGDGVQGVISNIMTSCKTVQEGQECLKVRLKALEFMTRKVSTSMIEGFAELRKTNQNLDSTTVNIENAIKLRLPQAVFEYLVQGLEKFVNMPLLMPEPSSEREVNARVDDRRQGRVLLNILQGVMSANGEEYPMNPGHPLQTNYPPPPPLRDSADSAISSCQETGTDLNSEEEIEKLSETNIGETAAESEKTSIAKSNKTMKSDLSHLLHNAEDLLSASTSAAALPHISSGVPPLQPASQASPPPSGCDKAHASTAPTSTSQEPAGDVLEDEQILELPEPSALTYQGPQTRKRRRDGSVGVEAAPPQNKYIKPRSGRRT